MALAPDLDIQRFDGPAARVHELCRGEHPWDDWPIMARRGGKRSNLVHARIAPEVVLLANGDVWIHGGVGQWSHALLKLAPVTNDERWVAAKGRCLDEGTGLTTPPADAVVWDAAKQALRSAKTWPGKPALGRLALDGGVTLRVGGKQAEDAGRLGMRDSSIDAVVIEGPGKSLVARLKLAVARADPTLTPLRDGRVVVSGGYTITTDFSWEDVLHGDTAVEIIDPKLGTVKRAGNLQVARYHHAAIEVAPGRVLNVGGSSRDGTPIDAVELIAV